MATASKRSGRAAASRGPREQPAVGILVHGAWHGAWCWDPVVRILRERRMDVRTIDLPSRGNPKGDLHGDADAVRELVGTVGGPVVLVGHSYGGAVITEASAGVSNIRHLVYLAAIMPEEGQTVMEAGAAPEPAADGADPSISPDQVLVPNDDGTMSCNPAIAGDYFYADCDPADVTRAVAALVPQPFDTFTQAVTGSGWRRIPSTYVVCEKDRCLDPELQRRLSGRAAAVVNLPTSHSPFMSNPRVVADIVAGVLA